MSESPPPVEPRLLRNLQEIAQWREATESSSKAKVEQVDAEEAALAAQLAALKARLGELRAERSSLQAELTALDAEELRRSHHAVIASLREDCALLKERAALYDGALEASRARSEAMLQDQALASALEEYDAFSEAEDSLAGLPSSYRKAIEAHHADVKTRLQPLFAELAGEHLSVETTPAVISVVASVAHADDQPEVLVLVIPVEASFLESWERRPQDLCATLAYRMMAAAVRIASRLGAPEAPIRHKGFEDHVAIWIWLRDSVIEGDLQGITQEEVARVVQPAKELTLTQVQLEPLWLPADVLQEPDPPASAETATPPVHEGPSHERLSVATLETAPGEEVNDDDTEDEEIPAAVIAEEEPIPDFYITEPEA